ncbi:MAG: BglG family transcription antiterminator [Erysipelotrichaceae bacterium]|jgi:lichenan operon transcriptional antiterminator|nr:BglG family transcription antiterminator [Erysipelotrichaceae bacterium]
MMEKRAINIIRILAQHKDYITADELCDQIGIRPRTLREDLRTYRDVIERESGAILTSKPNHGYHLEICDPQRFTSFMKDILKQEAENQYLMPVLQEDRIQYIIRCFLGAKDYLKSDFLADSLYISKSTFSMDLKQVKERLAFFHLRLQSKPGYGLKIAGEEIQIRSAIAQYFFNIDDYDLSQVQKAGLYLVDDFYQREVRHIVYQTIRQFHFKLTDFGYQNLVVHIIIALSRITHQMPAPEQIQADTEYEIALEIARKIKNKLQVQLPPGEIYYIILHLKGKKAYSRDEQLYISDKSAEVVRQVLAKINEDFDFQFEHDLELITMLTLHFEPMLHRIRYGLKIPNPLQERVKQDNPLAYDVAVCAATKIAELTGQPVAENEIGYMALHFQMALMRRKQAIKRNILIICASGAGSSQILLYKMKTKFNQQLGNVQVANAYELDQLDQSKFDFILSTIPLDKPTQIPVINVQYFLDEDDIAAVSSMIQKDSAAIAYIRSYFSSKLYFPAQSFDSYQEAIKFLCDKAKEIHALPEEFEELVLEREAIASTALDSGIALPHPAKLVLEENFLAIAHLDKPLEWQKKEVWFVILLGISKTPNPNLPYFNEVLSAFLCDRKAVKRLLSEPSYENLVAEIMRLTNTIEVGGEVFR